MPATKFIVRHPKGNGARSACVHFITFGRNYGPTQVDGRFPTILSLDLSHHLPPPPHLCESLTGLDEKLSESFFSIRENKEQFRITLDMLEQKMRLEPQGACVAVLINCRAGMHRSVAMAEKLAMEVRRWDGFKAECMHLDVGKGEQMQAENVARVAEMGSSEGIPARERRHSRHKASVTSEAQVSDKRRREAVATTDAALPRIEAPSRKKMVSWERTMSMRESHRQQRETVGMSAGSRSEDEHQTRRLSF